MPRQKDYTPRIGEPYFDTHRGKWAVFARGADGKRYLFRYETEEEARRKVAEFNEAVEEKTVTLSDAIDDYAKDQERRKLAKATRDTTLHRLKVLTKLYNVPLAQLTPARWAACYDSYHPGSDTTRHSTLRELKMFASWLQTQGRTHHDLAGRCVFEGEIHKGKAQLRRTESQRFADAALALYREEGNEAGLAVYMVLQLGLRTKEVLRRLVRDVDDNGTLLWITRATTKSDAGVRQIEVPPVLAEMLWSHVAGRKPEENLFQRQGAHYVNEWTKKICARAGLPIVTGQGLRGTFATLAVSEGVAFTTVARSIGHADPGITLGGSYAKLGSAQSGGARKMEKVLQSGTNTCNQVATKLQPSQNGTA